MRRSFDTIIEGIDEMLADHNAACYSSIVKVFYYSEKEVKELCELASKGNFPADTFEIWWDSVKKK